MESKKKPLWLTLKNADTGGDIQLMLKVSQCCLVMLFVSDVRSGIISFTLLGSVAGTFSWHVVYLVSVILG